MVIKDISLNNYRNFKNINIEFNDKINIFSGNNGQGKTNLIESIYYICYLRSFRTFENSSLITDKEKKSLIKANFYNNNEVYHSIIINILKEGKKVFLDDKVVRLSSELKDFFAIIISSDLINSYKYKNQFKRSFFDRVGFIFYQKYLEIIIEYQRILKYKNLLLKQKQTVELETWNFLMAQKVKEIFQIRVELVKMINTEFNDFYQKLTGKDNKISLEFQSNVYIDNDTKIDDLVQFFMDKTEMELKLGYSFRGPQKDNYLFSLDNQYSKSFSQGEYKTLFLALQFSINALIQKNKNNNSLVLLDDIFSEIDDKISQKLIELIYSVPNQIFITTTKILDFFVDKGKLFHVNDGMIYNQV